MVNPSHLHKRAILNPVVCWEKVKSSGWRLSLNIKLKWIFHFKGGLTLLGLGTNFFIYRSVNGIYLEVIIFRCAALKIFYYTREKIYPEFDTL